MLLRQKIRSLPVWCGAVFALIILLGRWSPLDIESTHHIYYTLVSPRTALLVVFLGLLVFDRRNAKRSIGVHRMAQSQLCFAFYFVCIASYFYSPMGSYSDSKLIDIFVLIIITASLRISSISLNRDFHTGFWLACIFVASLLALIALMTIAGGTRTAALGGGPITFARIIVVGFFGLVFFSDSLPRNTLPAALGVCVILILLSGSRGVLFSLLFAIPLLVFQNLALKKILGFLIALPILLFGLSHLQAFRTAVYVFEDRILRLTIAERYNAGRTDIYLDAYDTFLQNIFTGVGIGGFESSNFFYAHNIFLESSAELGILGLLLITGIILNSLRLALLSLSAFNPNPAAYTIVFFVISAQFSGDFYDSRWIFIMSFMLLFKNEQNIRSDTKTLVDNNYRKHDKPSISRVKHRVKRAPR